MRRTRQSLLYAIAYTLGGGTALALAPEATLSALGTNRDYGDVMPRVVGIGVVAFGGLIAQVWRLRLEAMYVTTAVVRAGIAIALLLVWLASDDPPFLYMSAVVGFGVVLTVFAMRYDRRPQPFTRLGRQRDVLEMP